MQVFQRIAHDLMARVVGPLHFRLLLQPAMATFFGIRDGRQDARNHKPPYFWAIFSDPVHALPSLKSGLKAVARVLILGLIMDVIYQLIALHWIYPGEAILVDLTLAFLPYLLIRGPANRIAVRWTHGHGSPSPQDGVIDEEHRA
jgi:hypothetical protein